MRARYVAADPQRLRRLHLVLMAPRKRDANQQFLDRIEQRRLAALDQFAGQSNEKRLVSASKGFLDNGLFYFSDMEVECLQR